MDNIFQDPVAGTATYNLSHLLLTLGSSLFCSLILAYVYRANGEVPPLPSLAQPAPAASSPPETGKPR